MVTRSMTVDKSSPFIAMLNISHCPATTSFIILWDCEKTTLIRKICTEIRFLSWSSFWSQIGIVTGDNARGQRSDVRGRIKLKLLVEIIGTFVQLRPTLSFDMIWGWVIDGCGVGDGGGDGEYRRPLKSSLRLVWFSIESWPGGLRRICLLLFVVTSI